MPGKSDNVVSGQPDSVVRQTLLDLIEKYGLSLADDPRRCEGLLRDLSGSCRREINILMAAVHERVATDLLGANDQLPSEVIVGRLVKRLVHNRGLTKDVAVWAVESWALAFGVMTSEELTPVPAPSPSKPPRIPPRKPPALAPKPVPRPLISTPPLRKKKWKWAWAAIIPAILIGIIIVQFVGSTHPKNNPVVKGPDNPILPDVVPSKRERRKNWTRIKIATEKHDGYVNLDDDQLEVMEIHLEQTKVTDEDLKEILERGQLTELKKLDLSKTQITDAGLVHLQGLTSLTQLSLDGTAISDAGLVHLKGLTSLTLLGLKETKITDAGLLHLYGLTRLERLHCSKTEVTMSGVEKLEHVLTSCTVKHKNRPENGLGIPRISAPDL